MENEVKISVLMPVYNTPEEFLRPAIESILTQTFEDFEFLILDDGSENNVLEVIREYSVKDKRVSVFHHNTNKNCPNSRNELLKNARGVYVAYMDSDDISYPDRLQKQYDYLEKHKDVSILGSYLELLESSELCEYPETIKYMDVLKACQMANNTVMMRLADIRKFELQYNKDFISAEDYEFWSKAVKYLKIKTIKEPLVKYRTGHTSLSSSNFGITLRNSEKVKISMLEFLTDDIELREKIRKLVEKKKKYTFPQRIFSVKNIHYRGKKYKVICILGIIFKCEVET